MLKDRLFKTGRLKFDNRHFGPEKFSELSGNRPQFSVGLIAQLVGHWNGIAKVRARVPFSEISFTAKIININFFCLVYTICLFFFPFFSCRTLLSHPVRFIFDSQSSTRWQKYLILKQCPWLTDEVAERRLKMWSLMKSIICKEDILRKFITFFAEVYQWPRARNCERYRCNSDEPFRFCD